MPLFGVQALHARPLWMVGMGAPSPPACRLLLPLAVLLAALPKGESS